MKNSIKLLCTLFLLSIVSNTILAQDVVGADYQPLKNQYELVSVDITDVPAGVTPIVIESPAQLQEILSGLSSPVVETSEPLASGWGEITLMSMGSADRACSVNAGFAWFQHDATFYTTDGVITNVWSRPSLQGLTLGTSLSDTSTNWWFTNAQETAAAARAEGTVNAYLLIDGGILLYSERMGCNVSYP